MYLGTGFEDLLSYPADNPAFLKERMPLKLVTAHI